MTAQAPEAAPKEDWRRHKKMERNVALFGLAAFAAVTIGGIVEIAPLFWIDNTIEKVDGMRPYTPLEQAGRDIYVREGCYVCHSQMIRPFRDEVERYGHYSLAAESMYDRPFQWNGTSSTSRIRAPWCRNRSCRPMPSWPIASWMPGTWARR
jgi:cbb3-type cytochrome c oxidase subunit II